MDIHTIDLEHLGHDGRIAAYLVIGPDGPVLIETGPFSCHQALVAGLARYGVEPADVRDVFVTHIHLDHAGAAGWWADAGATVHVHAVGAPHLVDPSKLIASATRLYGVRMDPLWGEIRPAPEARVRVVEDGEVIQAGGLEIEALASPGHASHHHVYRLGGVAFTGDLAAIVIPGTRLIEIPTPPPDYQLGLWLESIERVLDLDLDAIYPTHFGRVNAVGEHFARVGVILREATQLVHRLLESGATRDELEERFADWTRQRYLADGATEDQIRDLLDFNPPTLSLAGILRYWKKSRGLLPRDTG